MQSISKEKFDIENLFKFYLFLKEFTELLCRKNISGYSEPTSIRHFTKEHLEEMTNEIAILFSILLREKNTMKSNLDHYLDSCHDGTKNRQYSADEKHFAEILLSYVKEYKGYLLALDEEFDYIDNDEKEKLNDLVNSDTGLKKIIEEGINFYKEVFSDDEAALEKVRYKPMTQEDVENLFKEFKREAAI
jgi:hypothetical protein